jgi:transposase
MTDAELIQDYIARNGVTRCPTGAMATAVQYVWHDGDGKRPPGLYEPGVTRAEQLRRFKISTHGSPAGKRALDAHRKREAQKYAARAAQMIELRIAGKSCSEIGKMFGVSRDAVSKHTNTYATPEQKAAFPNAPEPKNVERNAQIKQLWAEGKSAKEIAALFGIGHKVVYNVVNRK